MTVMSASIFSMVDQPNFLNLWFNQRFTNSKIMPRSYMAKFLFFSPLTMVKTARSFYRSKSNI